MPWLLSATLGGSAAALAQSPACDQFKDTVATRIPAEALGTLVIAAASTPVPPGAKVVGTCDGGAFKILHYRRGLTPQAANADNAASAPSASSSASAASAVAAAPRVAARASAPVAAASRPEPAKPVVAKLSDPVKPVVVPKPPEAAASPVAMAPAVVVPALPDTRDTRDTRDEPLMRDPPPPPPDGPGWVATATDALVAHWPWTLGAVLLVLGAWGWSWFSHRQSYDAAGLPRGPKL
ncbi:hypothetical protein ASE08_27050 [Rhizobacter sp. Root16D2]|nr:hypothetical protein ASC88_11685 [Rhizobacter sp. Root29]KQW02775.1 hypothetical protein ASC98_28075 [Rhizobacter sp. Root1238]KRB15593.1 hypothetical protein ASE08_27050 [Rhizobacter sp. Root16D2]